MKYTFPAEYGERTYMVPIDAALVPIIAGALRKFFDRGVWNSASDYEAGYNAFASLLANMAQVTLNDLVEANRQIYRLLDSALNGTGYSVNNGEITPAIPAVPLNQPGQQPGLRRQLIDMQGETGGWFGIGARPATLADLLQASRVNNTTDQGVINDAVEEVLQAAASGTSIASVISNVLAGAADVATDGGVVATLIATAAASAAQQGLLAAQIDRLIAAIDGGGLQAPTDNVLAALRGTAPAGANRNLADMLDQAEALLTEIRDKVQ